NHCAGKAGCPGEPVVTTRVLSTFAHGAAGAAGTRLSLRPRFRGERFCKTRAHRVAGRRSYSSRHDPRTRRSGIPETLIMKLRGRGVLDIPHARGITY